MIQFVFVLEIHGVRKKPKQTLNFLVHCGTRGRFASFSFEDLYMIFVCYSFMFMPVFCLTIKSLLSEQ
jgi:hypothetical protein